MMNTKNKYKVRQQNTITDNEYDALKNTPLNPINQRSSK